MSIITLDFESYYDKEYSLSKLTTEQYINDPRFEVIGFSIKLDNNPAQWYSGTPLYLLRQLQSYDWAGSVLICHNTIFDGAILKWKFDIQPDFYIDTYSMARALGGPDIGGSLGKLVSEYGAGVKGDEVVHAMGKHLWDFSPEALQRYANYCINDTELAYKLFLKMSDGFPESELELIDQTMRMFINPSLKINKVILVNRLQEIKQEKSKLLEDLQARLGCSNEEEVRKQLASTNKFSEILNSYGIEVPMKQGKNNVIPALAKTDLGFIALEEHDNPFIQQLCAARLGVRSTLEETRIGRFIGVCERNQGYLPVPLKYYAAHPGRWGGMDSINLQNLPTRDVKKKTLKNSIIAPPGCLIINADLSQIEARILAWLAGQTDLLESFRLKKDVYSEFASDIYNKLITKANPVERFVGKTCILGLGYGTGAIKLQNTLEITPPGAILDINKCHNIVKLYRTKNIKITKLWRQGDLLLKNLMSWPSDGRSFYFGEHELIPVTPYGIRLPNGLYIRYNNLRVHNGQIVYDSRKGPVSIWGGVVTENCLSEGTLVLTRRGWILIEEVTASDQVHDGVDFVTHGGVVFKSVQQCVNIDGVWMTPEHEVLTNDGWQAAIRKPKPYRPTIRGITSNISCQKQWKALGMAFRVYLWENCRKNWQGCKKVINSWWVPSLWTRDESKTFCRKSHPRNEQTPGICSVAQYDRSVQAAFTSILQKLRRAWNISMRALEEIREFLARHDANLSTWIGFRSETQRWKLLSEQLSLDRSAYEFDEQKEFVKNRRTRGSQTIGDSAIYSVLQNQTRPVYDILNAGPRQRFIVKGHDGPFIVHNCVQALARLVIAENMLKIRKLYNIALTVHDSLVLVIPEKQLDECLAFVENTMSTPPDWAPGLPVAVEIKHGLSYGEC